MTIKKLDLISSIKTVTVLFALLGLLAGICYSFGGLITDAGVSLGWFSAEAMETPGLSQGTWLAFGALIGMPLIGAVMGFIIGAICVPLFNLASKWTGGIKIELKK